MSHYEDIIEQLKQQPKTWLVTGCAGFIGSNLLEFLLNLNQRVVGLDNFITGHQENLDEVQKSVTPEQWDRFNFIFGDICLVEDCKKAVEGVDYVLHQAALGSVPRSIVDPIATNNANISGFLNMLVASKDAGVTSFTFAASSSTYGDHPNLPKVEDKIGNALSPYAVTKLVNEIYADVFSRTYNFNCIGLRYFNIFGKRQDPNGAYAAVIPKWADAMLTNDGITINGDGSISRDYCFIENAIQANILASVANEEAKNNIYNVAVGDRTTLTELFNYIKSELINNGQTVTSAATYGEPRAGDVLHSQANLQKIKSLLGYDPLYNVPEGLAKTMPWYINKTLPTAQK